MHDVQECCRVLFDCLRPRRDGRGLFFTGQLTSTLRCLECGNERSREEAFADVPLGIEGIDSLEAALADYVTAERLDGDDRWHCDVCERRVAALKGVAFSHLPPILMLNLKRYRYDAAMLRRTKLTHRVAFPERLSMRPFMRMRGHDCDAASGGAGSSGEGGAGGAGGAGVSGEGGERGEGGVDSSGEGGSGDGGDGGGDYRLVGALLHRGSAQKGHYSALLRARPPPPSPPQQT